MSIESLRWALRQSMKDPGHQLMIVTLGNAADPDGLAFGWWRGRDHWIDYLVQRTRQSRATCFRQIREFQELGLITREIIVHDNGAKQHLIQLNLSAYARWEQIAADGGMGYVVDQVGDFEPAAPAPHPDLDPGLQAEQMVDAESQIETEKPERGEGASLTGETERVSVVRLHKSPDIKIPDKESPQTPTAPAAPPRASEREPGARALPPIGFNTFKANYPQRDLVSNRSWEQAETEFVKLNDLDRRKVPDATLRYAQRIARFNRKPINPARWLRDREFDKFTEIAAGNLAIGRVFVAAGPPPFEAWSNVLSVVYGDPGRIPPTYGSRGPHGERGILVPAELPVGGLGWIVPREQWVFVEQYTSQFNRYNERAFEILGRGIMPVRANAPFVKDHHRKIGRGEGGALSSPNAFGALVPLEWPPPKGERKPATGPPPDLTDEDVEAFAGT